MSALSRRSLLAALGVSVALPVSALPSPAVDHVETVEDLLHACLGRLEMLNRRFDRLPDNDPECLPMLERMDAVLDAAAALRPDTALAWSIKAKIAQRYPHFSAGEAVQASILVDLIARGAS